MTGPLRIELVPYELDTRLPFHISRQRAPGTRHSVQVRLVAADGTEGWGEAPAIPYYGETRASLLAVLPVLGDEALAAAEGDPLALQRVEQVLDGATTAGRGARAGISAAFHDLAARSLGVPVWRMLGLSPQAAVSSYTIGMDTPAIIRERLRAAAAFPIIKVKIGGAGDEELLRTVREERPDARLRVDANTAWSAEEAIAALPMLQHYHVELLEQPLAPDDIEGFRRLRSRSEIPLFADESCVQPGDLPRLAGAVDGVNLKLAKCGGIQEVLRMIHCARALGLEVMLGCMVESTLGIAAAVQLAPLVDHLDLDGAALLANDPFVGPGMEEGGVIRFNEEPGLGVRRRGPE